MKNLKKKFSWAKIGIVTIVVLMVAGVFIYKDAIRAEKNAKGQEQIQTSAVIQPPVAVQVKEVTAADDKTLSVVPAEPSQKTPKKMSESQSLPRLIDFGALWCGPCQQQAPILEEIKSEYAGRVNVELIDVSEKTVDANKYKIRVIPTQIFMDASGNEFLRHEGLMSKADIEAVFAQMGVK